MANSNNRTKDQNTIHHVGSRIAHKVYFLEEDERNDFLEMARRVAVFSGIRLVGWCVMTNHFHVLLYLPVREFVDEGEVLRRYGALKGAAVAEDTAANFRQWRQSGESGEKQVAEWLDGQRRRMYDVSEFMKILKQWFTEEYNRRHAHKGTLWEAAYFDRIVPYVEAEIAECLAYIHLNPIRAAIVPTYSGYRWSSYSAFTRGDQSAVEGMRIAYGDDASIADIVCRHEELMARLLEKEKLRRAEEIAMKRAAGYDMPADSLTTEAMVAQAQTRIDEVRRESMTIREQREMGKRGRLRSELIEQEMVNAIRLHPDFSMPQIQEILALPRSTFYRILAKLKANGVIAK